MPDWIEVLVPESQKDEYEQSIPNPIVTTPDDVIGLGRLRNWCLDNFHEETLVMVDDDINAFYRLTGAYSESVEDPEEFVQIIINTAVMAKDAGCGVFSFQQTDIRKYNGTEPFALSTWGGTIIGVIGRKFRFRDDKFKVDIDFFLQNLLVNRIVWVDNRYYANNRKDLNSGGNAEFRTEDEYNRSIETLAEKWGDCLRISDFKNQKRIRFNFTRRQTLKYD